MPPEIEGGDQKRKSAAFANDDEFIMSNDFISPASSSRYLLGDKAKFNFSSEFHHVPPLPSPPPPRQLLNSHNGNALNKKYDDLLTNPPPPPAPQSRPSPPPYDSDDESLSFSPPKPPPSPPPEFLKYHNSNVCNEKHQDSLSSVASKPSSPPPPPSSDQVVVLEVSLHCRGCERKMKRHISKIEGVTSFKIDFAAKKVTVVGDVTPLAVLKSVLKVKNAKLLTPATISSSSSQTGRSNRSHS